MNTKFDRDIKFSIIVPLYNTPLNFLVEMIDSVKNQTYTNWELCLADGSDENHSKVQEICTNYMNEDSRIKYKKLEKNLGISENTNACLDMSEGEYIGLFDHDDLLHPSALYYNMVEICKNDTDFIYSDELTFSNSLSQIVEIHAKPDFAPDNLRGNNYITHFSVFKRTLLNEVGYFRKEFDGSQDHDMILRLTEKAKKITHIPKVLYYWRSHDNSVAKDINAKSYAVDAGINAVQDHLHRCGYDGTVESVTHYKTFYRTIYKIKGEPLVSILIPNKDNLKLLKKCVSSILELSTYKNIEIVIVENNSTNDETFKYYEEISKNPKITVAMYESDGVFNFSKINNFGIQYCRGEYVILLNNDIEVITENWIEEMLMLNQRDDVAIVGAKLIYPNNIIQHAGVIVGLGKIAGHGHKAFPRNYHGFMGRLLYVQNYSAVTGACLMVKKDIYLKLGGLDEENFAVAFNDIDFCLRVRELGYLICYTPFAELYHYESISRGYEDTPEKKARFNRESQSFSTRWEEILKNGDPYYNPNLTLDNEKFDLIV